MGATTRYLAEYVPAAAPPVDPFPAGYLRRVQYYGILVIHILLTAYITAWLNGGYYV